MRYSKKELEKLRIANQKKVDLATQWFLNLKKGMPVFIQDNEINKEKIAFCLQDVIDGKLQIFHYNFNYEDRLLVNGVGRIWLNGSHGIYLYQATKQLIETTPIFIPQNTSPELMQSITGHLNKVFS